MKNYIQCIHITAFAAAIALGGSLSARETIQEDTRIRVQQGQRSSLDHTRLVKASDVLGMNIDTPANEKVGEIDEIFIHFDSGKVLAIVASTGGFLGMGQHQTLLSPEDLRFNNERTLMQTDLSKDQIRSSPPYKKGETTGLDQVRPLGRIALRGEERSERSNRGAGRQNASNRPISLDERSERSNQIEVVQSNRRGLAVSDLIGMRVENRQGDSVGKVDEVLLDLDKREVAGVVISTGGFLGIGDRKTLFGLRELTLDSTNEKVLLDYTRDQVRAFPEFKPNEQAVFDDLRERLNRLDPRANRSR